MGSLGEVFPGECVYYTTRVFVHTRCMHEGGKLLLRVLNLTFKVSIQLSSISSRNNFCKIRRLSSTVKPGSFMLYTPFHVLHGDKGS